MTVRPLSIRTRDLRRLGNEFRQLGDRLHHLGSGRVVVSEILVELPNLLVDMV